jgi:hypothetical protein
MLSPIVVPHKPMCWVESTRFLQPNAKPEMSLPATMS